jgi:hypothetical protein
MILVKALGPLGKGGGATGLSAAGREKTWVAPPESLPLDRGGATPGALLWLCGGAAAAGTRVKAGAAGAVLNN